MDVDIMNSSTPQRAQTGSEKKRWDFTELQTCLSLESLNEQPTGVGLLYDDRMLDTHNTWVPTYPECPDRLSVSLERCSKYGLIERCVQISTRIATEDEILLQHSKEYFDLVRRSSEMSLDELKNLSMKFDGIYFSPATFKSSMIAAGCSIEAVEQVVQGKIRNSMAIVRPPGHHAMRDEACGYCFFNNAAIAAKYAIEKLGLERILLVDWDLHHGQGSQFMFYDDPRVIYFSIHRYEYGLFWPNLRESDYDYIGDGNGRGFNINVPFNKVGMTDGDYMAIMHQILMPVALEFKPQLVIVSCGYDAAIGDPEGRSEVSPACYAHFTHMMKQISGGKLSIIFEGGYCLKSLAEGVALTLRSLLDDPCPRLPSLAPPMESTRESILNTIRVLRPFWKCFALQSDAESDDQLPEFCRNFQIPKEGVTFFNNVTRPESFDLDIYETFSDAEQEILDKKIDQLIADTQLLVPLNRTCLAYDDLMERHRCSSGSHPERPDRTRRIYDSLAEFGLLARCKLLETRRATVEEVSLVHHLDYIHQVQKYETCSEEELGVFELSELAARSVYISQATYDCAMLAVGCTLSVIDEVLTGKSRNGFAIVRPPGHHAVSFQPNGFCFFNSIAIAAKYCQLKYSMSRILIVDWDIHHGNGTQDTFIDDKSVLFISIHRRPFYPDGDGNAVTVVGEASGTGFNVNIPWSRGGQGDAEYMAAFQQIVMPIAYEFSPELVLVSAGFDAARGDPLGGCCVTPEGFGQMTHMLNSLAGGRVVLVLEGGYNLNSLAESAAVTTSVLLGDSTPPVNLSTINEDAVQTIQEVIDVHHIYWKSLAFNVKLPSRQSTLTWLESQKQSIDALPPTYVSPIYGPLASDYHQPSISKNISNENDLKSQFDIEVGIDRAEEGATAATCDSSSLHDYLAEMAQGLDQLELHAVEPLPWCPHIASVVHHVTHFTTNKLNTRAPCRECGDLKENWVCLTCHEVYCSRFSNGHMLDHTTVTGHPMVLSFSDLSIWCYQCDSYIDNISLMTAKRAAYSDKFNEQMPQLSQ